MKTRFLVVVALALLSICSCQAKVVEGNGSVITKDIPVEAYRSIVFSGCFSGGTGFWSLFRTHNRKEGTFSCRYSQQEKATLRITIDENLYEHLSIRSENGELVITTEKNKILSPTDFQVVTGSKELEKVIVTGGMDFYLDTPLSGSSLQLISSGGADVYMEKAVRMESCECKASGGSDVSFDDLVCSRFDGTSSGGSDIVLKGKADEAEMNASGGSDIKAYSFIVSNLTCSASGGSDIYAYATEQLDASASGGSDVHYKGSAKVESSASGGSDIDKED